MSGPSGEAAGSKLPEVSEMIFPVAQNCIDVFWCLYLRTGELCVSVTSLENRRDQGQMKDFFDWNLEGLL